MTARSPEERELFGRWLESNPYREDPAEAWVLPRRVAAWVVVGQLKLDYQNAELVAAQYQLPLEAVEAVGRYYNMRRQEIDARIAANRAFYRC